MTMLTDSEYRITIHDLPNNDRPRERLQNYGAAALSNTELLAILLRTGIRGENVINLSTRLLTQYGGLLGLSKAGFNEMSKFKGVGPAKTCQLKAALELGRRLASAAPTERFQIARPEDAANLILAEMTALEQEHMRLILLDTKHFVISIPTIYIGTVNTSIIRVSEIFKCAVKENSTAIIVAHNHPSGDPTPSAEDIDVTERIIEAGQLLDIDVLDHLIFGNQSYVSLKQKGVEFQLNANRDPNNQKPNKSGTK